MTEPQQPRVTFELSDELANGVYSNLAVVWHTAYDFTLDFAVMQPAQVATTETGESVPIIPARIVARVKLPPAAVFELMQSLSTNERLYEEQYGPIRRPGRPDTDPPLYPPGG